ncbi:MAG: class I SAM-dependent methyltransferase [Candidatus Electrothrix sp. GW3-4]|uniref:class I SAM-dependent methyltransferase n=1 Tax=Candidatus Electrothrix sp. GW3-4 TaxID=3126740 RepID=UPI0030D4A3FD
MMRKYWYLFLKHQDYMLGLWVCKAMQWRGFSSHPIHPKHLFDVQRSEFLHGLFQPRIRFLDLGAGVGTDCLLAADKGAIFSVGLEGNWRSIQTGVERAKKKKSTAEFLQINLEQGLLPFADESFDLINFSNVLEHLHNRAGILSELKRVKKKDGLGVISVPNANTSWKKKLKAAGLDPRDDPDHKIEYSQKSLAEELHAAGLSICSELMPIIPSFPWNGLIAMSAALSPVLYKRLQQAKREYVLAHPDESIGWVFTVK